MGLRNFKKENFRPYFPLLFENTETEEAYQKKNNFNEKDFQNLIF